MVYINMLFACNAKVVYVNISFQCKHTYICDNHKNVIQKARNKRKRSPHSEDENDSVDVSCVHVHSVIACCQLLYFFC